MWTESRHSCKPVNTLYTVLSFRSEFLLYLEVQVAHSAIKCEWDLYLGIILLAGVKVNKSTAGCVGRFLHYASE